MAGGPGLLHRHRDVGRSPLVARGMRAAIWIVPLVMAVVAGALADGPGLHEPMTVGGYRVLQADFHTHSSTWSDGALTPIGMVLEARARGLDAFAIAGHNQMLDS